MQLSLNTVMLGTDDPERLIGFYRQVLGEPAWSDSAYTGWSVGAGWLMIGGHDQVKGQNEMPGRMILNFEAPDVHAEFDRIKTVGATVVAEPYEPGAGMVLATFADPDGNYFQLASPVTDEMIKEMQEQQGS